MLSGTILINDLRTKNKGHHMIGALFTINPNWSIWMQEKQLTEIVTIQLNYLDDFMLMNIFELVNKIAKKTFTIRNIPT